MSLRLVAITTPPLLLLLGTLAVACRPTPTSSPPEPASTDPSTTSSPPTQAETETETDPDAPPPDDDLPKTCSITVQLLDPGGVTGKGSSTGDSAAAKDAAWADACEQLRKAQKLDCRDDSVAVRAERSSSIGVKHGSGSVKQHYKHTVTLTTQRRATGFSDAPGGREQACAQAKAKACEELVGGPCPTEDLRVIAVDGRAPRPAAVEPPRADPPSPPAAM